MKLCCRNELIKAAEDLMDRHREGFSDEVNTELDAMAIWLQRRAAGGL